MNEMISSSPEETESLAAQWSAGLDQGIVVLLNGDLGAGKTCFSRGFLSGRGGKPEDVSSPSFALVNEYRTPAGKIYHWDLYRLEAHMDWSVLDLEEHLGDAKAFTLIEWPERHPDLKPTQSHTVHIEAINETQRNIRISENLASWR
ncbi:MAG: tRNA (adenosine(37)-N6)-threonylcarbamoyltransferase complex ATPase subunit type 1 TsaE [Verrucomicrobiota bacterium]